MMLRRLIGFCVAASILSAAPVVVASPMCEARGMVVDHEGNPLKDAVITFVPFGGTMEYSGKSNKKGRYYVPGMFNSQGDRWTVIAKLEGYVPTKMVVETRTVNKVLVGDIYSANLNPSSGPQKLTIRQMGNAKVDFTMTPEDQVAQHMAAQAPEAGQAETAESLSAAPVQPKVDPWDMALNRAAEGDLEGSVEFFDKAIGDEPEDAERRGAYAKVLYQLQRYDEAESQATASVELAPDNIDNRMVLYSINVGRGDLEAAKVILEETKAVAPGDVRILQQLAFIASESGDTTEAIAAYEALTEADPENSDGWLSLGDLYAASGELGKSEQAYQRVVELEPADAHQIFFNIGALTINKPNRSDAETRKAINAFRKAIEIKPDYLQAHKQLAYALLGVGDRAGACQALERYVELAPEASDAQQMRSMIATLKK
jgi:tetratricopeptide (TPR) repeat protein